MERISSPHPNSLEVKSCMRKESSSEVFDKGFQHLTIRAMFTSTGHSATFSPISVKRPSVSSIPEATNPSRARNTLSAGGQVTHSNFMRSSIPKDFSCRIGVVKSVRVSSGDVATGRDSKTKGG